jgi:hypothetical protein
MMGSMMRRAMISGGISARKFFKDVANGTDSLDLLIAGDSNTNFGGWGWADGLNYALKTDTSAVEYATPILPTTSWDSPFYYGVDVTTGAFSKINASGTVVNPNGSPSLGGTLASGRASGPADLTNTMTRGSGNLQPNTSPFDYGWIASGDWADPFQAVYMYESSAVPTWITQQLQYRVVHGKGPGMGTLRLGSRRDSSPFTKLGDVAISCAQSSYEWVTSALTISADSGRSGIQYAFNVCSNNISASGGGTCRMTGPMAIAMHSVCTPRKGYSVTCISHHGGANMDTVASNLSQGVSIVKQYLREARQRQIACGGSGRVVVAIQGGVNTGINSWRSSAESFFSICSAAWSQLGYPESDLAFLGFVSHQKDSVDGMTAERASALAMSLDYPRYEIVDLTSLISYSELLTGASGTSYFANASTEREHLTQAGYKEVSKRFVLHMIA